MPDLNSVSDFTLTQWRQDPTVASQDEAIWRFMLMTGTGLLIVLAVAAVILAAYWFSAGRRRTPPPPRSIITPPPERRWRYTEKERR